MDEQSQAERTKANREASQWSVLLRDDPDDADLRRRFDAWLAAAPLHRELWRATERVSELAVTALPAFAHEWQAAPENVVPLRTGTRAMAGAQTGARRRWWWAGLTIGAAAAALAIASPSILLHWQADHVAGVAEMREISLDDGSTVTLASGSAISVDLRPAERRVVLLQGEAYFGVTPDASRPFRVAAGTVEASVLGTRFDVRLDPNDVLVAVTEGSVRVRSAAWGEVVNAGQAVRVDRAAGGFQPGESPIEATAWRHGQLYLKSRPLAEAIDILRRHFRGTIVVASPSLGERATTGVFNLGDPEEALRGMAHAHGAVVRRMTPWMLVISAF